MYGRIIINRAQETARKFPGNLAQSIAQHETKRKSWTIFWNRLPAWTKLMRTLTAYTYHIYVYIYGPVNTAGVKNRVGQVLQPLESYIRSRGKLTTRARCEMYVSLRTCWTWSVFSIWKYIFKNWFLSQKKIGKKTSYMYLCKDPTYIRLFWCICDLRMSFSGTRTISGLFLLHRSNGKGRPLPFNLPRVVLCPRRLSRLLLPAHGICNLARRWLHDPVPFIFVPVPRRLRRQSRQDCQEFCACAAAEPRPVWNCEA